MGININKYIGWFLVSFFVYFQFLIQTSSSLMQSDWAQYFHVSTLGVSMLSASFFYTYLALQIPVGIIYDQFCMSKVLATASFCLGIGCIIFATTKNYNLAIISRMIMGGSAAFGFIGMLKFTASYFPGKQFPMMMGISEAFAAIASMVGVAILSIALNYTSWNTLCIYFALTVFSITFLVMIFVKNPPNSLPKKFKFTNLLKNIHVAITNRTVLITGIYGFFMFSVVNSFNSLWGLAFLTKAYPISNEIAARVMSTVFLGLAIGCPINGYFSKRFGHERESMLFCSAVCALCMALIIYVKVSLVLLYILFFIVGLMCAIYVQSFAIIGQAMQQEVQGTAMAVANMIIMSSAPILQILIGAILEKNSFGLAHSSIQNFQFALSVLPAGMMIAFIISFYLKKNLWKSVTPSHRK